MDNNIVNTICNSCQCDETQAQEYLKEEIRVLSHLRDAGDIRYKDFENTCMSLGLETDNIEYLLSLISY